MFTPAKALAETNSMLDTLLTNMKKHSAAQDYGKLKLCRAEFQEMLATADQLSAASERAAKRARLASPKRVLQAEDNKVYEEEPDEEEYEQDEAEYDDEGSENSSIDYDDDCDAWMLGGSRCTELLSDCSDFDACAKALSETKSCDSWLDALKYIWFDDATDDLTEADAKECSDSLTSLWAREFIDSSLIEEMEDLRAENPELAAITFDEAGDADSLEEAKEWVCRFVTLDCLFVLPPDYKQRVLGLVKSLTSHDKGICMRLLGKQFRAEE